jgi:lysophospholipase L1-like esterase
MAEFLRTQGVQLVVVNHPVNPAGFFPLLPRGAEDYALYRERLRAAADAAGVPYYDAHGTGLEDPTLFVDSVHHNADGTRAMSQALSDFLARSGVLHPENGRADRAQHG